MRQTHWIGTGTDSPRVRRQRQLVQQRRGKSNNNVGLPHRQDGWSRSAQHAGHLGRVGKQVRFPGGRPQLTVGQQVERTRERSNLKVIGDALGRSGRAREGARVRRTVIIMSAGFACVRAKDPGSAGQNPVRNA